MNELLNLEWFSGDVGGYVGPVINFIGVIASCVISIVGFAIVLSSILKNATHGLYATSPKFWDRVYDVKMGQAAVDSGGTGVAGNINKVLGTVTSVTLGFLPNIKALTDFEKTQMDIKHYFIKSIPAMCVAIFVGVFIYLGYPAQVSGKISAIGTFTIDGILASMDPQAIVETIPELMTKPKLETDSASTDEDKIVNKIAYAAEGVLTSYLSTHGVDIPKENRQAYALQIENAVMSTVHSKYSSYADFEQYSVDVSAAVHAYGQRNFTSNGQADANNVVVFHDGIFVNTLNTGAENVVDISNWWLYWSVTFTPKTVRQTSNRCEGTLYVPNVNAAIEGDILTIDLTSLAGSSGARITVTSDKAVTCGSTKFKTQSASDSVIKLKRVEGDISSYNQLVTNNAVKYKVGDTVCLITNIIVGGDSVYFTTSDGVKFSFGENPSSIASAN